MNTYLFQDLKEFMIFQHMSLYISIPKKTSLKKYSLSHKIKVEKSLQNEQNQVIQKTTVKSKEDINYIFLNTKFKKIDSSEIKNYIFTYY